MIDKIKVNLATDHTWECLIDIIGREGEGNTTRFEITVPEKLVGWSVYLDFTKPNGEKLRTPKLKIENGVVYYDVVPYLLTDDGELKVQAVIISANNQTWKSSNKTYHIQDSIDALEEIPEKDDFMSEAQRILDELNGRIEDVTEALAKDEFFVDAITKSFETYINETTEELEEFVENEVFEEIAKKSQLKAEFVQSVDELNALPEEARSKLYVLTDKDSPDYGYIFAYKYSETTGQNYKNLSKTVHENQRMGSGGTLSALTGAVTTDFIPVKKGQTVRFKGVDFANMESKTGKYPYICFYTEANESAIVSTGKWDRLDWLSNGDLLQNVDGVWTYTAFVSHENNSTPPHEHPLSDTITHIRLCGMKIEGEDVIVTVDEEITEGSTEGGYSWKNTGLAFVPAEYENRIVELEKYADAIPESRIEEIENALNKPNQSDYNGNILYGKKWVACGDSFTAGGYNASDGFADSVHKYTDGRFAGQEIVYPFIIGLRNNMTIKNLATGGQTMAITSANNSFMTRYENIDADADYITIMLGINDKIQGVSVGALDSVDNTTFCGAFNVAMEHIIENHPFAHIGIMVSHGTNAEIMQATRGIAERWGVPYLDYGSPQVPLMNRYTGKNVCAKAQQIREKNFCVISDGTNPTNAHPNTKAHEYESTFIEAWLRTL